MTLLSNMLRTAADCVQAGEHGLAHDLLTRYRQLRADGLPEPRIAAGLFGDSFARNLWQQHLDGASSRAAVLSLGGQAAAS